jgi:uncharacterized Ntn-hydrolase superfamily protein
MTISILAIDEKTGRIGGAAMTGSLCVGGWVLRGHPDSGMSASQGTAPSTLWGEAVLDAMRAGMPAAAAVSAVTGRDEGNAHRQLAALDASGRTGAFTGDASVPHADAAEAPGVVVAGNMLCGAEVIEAALGTFGASGDLPFPERLMASLGAAAEAGGDARGLLSAALLVLGRDIAPLTLRIDHAADPLAALAELYRVSQAEPYRSWTDVVPVLDDPFRAPADAVGDVRR